MPKKYQFLIYLINNPLQNTASTKAVQDCAQILTDNGYESLNIYVTKDIKTIVVTLFKLLLRFINIIRTVERGSVVFVQYPQHFANNQVNFLIKLLKKVRKCRAICITHDVESIRPNVSMSTAKEVGWFNDYDVVITHNDIMKAWLVEHGLKSPAISLDLFDYLLPQQAAEIAKPITADVAFAGNLIKSVFVAGLDQLTGVQFNLYGPAPDSGALNKPNVKWQGSFSPEEIPFKLEGKYGLIWDGEELERCSGVLGDYMRYNNPHKLSLYIASGLPVIVPGHSAIAQFVKKHNIGITVDNLHNLRSAIDSVTAENYDQFKNNIKAISSRITRGDYFTDAIGKAEVLLKVK